MARPKTVEDNIILDLIEKYYLEKCGGNSAKLKLPDIADYIAKETNTSYKVTQLRRNSAAREYIDVLKDTVEQKQLSVVVTFKSLDIDNFLIKNRTKSSLKTALSELDSYYKTIADSAVELNRNSKEIQDRLTKIEKEKNLFQKELELAENKIQELKKELNQYRINNDALSTVVNTYVYPEIANKLLEKEGFLTNTNDVIIDIALEENIVTTNTDIFSESNVIQGLFDKYKGE